MYAGQRLAHEVDALLVEKGFRCEGNCYSCDHCDRIYRRIDDSAKLMTPSVHKPTSDVHPEGHIDTRSMGPPKYTSELKQVSVSADGSYICGVNVNGQVMCRAGVDGSWHFNKEGGELLFTQVSVSAAGHVWGVTEDQRVWRCDRFGSPWRQVHGALQHVSVSANGKHVWGVSTDGRTWYRDGSGGTKGDERPWANIPRELS